MNSISTFDRFDCISDSPANAFAAFQKQSAKKKKINKPITKPVIKINLPPKKNLTLGEIKSETERIIRACLDKLGAKWNRTFPMPKVDYFSLTGTTAGEADSSKYLIRLNQTLLMQNWELFKKQTIPHEVCHLVANKLWVRPLAHGEQWKSLMLTLGCSLEACHKFDTALALAEKGKISFKYQCFCRIGNTPDSPFRTWAVEEKKHKALKAGKGKIVCPKCHVALKCVDPMAAPKVNPPTK